jgi:Holliday junction resolvasome RuvABC endonuclease subunit
MKSEAMRVLGIDPGLRSTGWCALYGTLASKPDHDFYDRSTSSTYYFDTSRAVLAVTATLRRRDEVGEESWTDQLCSAMAWIAAVHDCQLIAIEDFTHRGWMGRRVNTSAAMGKLVGALCQYVRTAVPHPLVVVRAEDTKRGMDAVRPWFRNPHEHSAFCAASFGRSRHLLDLKATS